MVPAVAASGARANFRTVVALCFVYQMVSFSEPGLISAASFNADWRTKTRSPWFSADWRFALWRSAEHLIVAS